MSVEPESRWVYWGNDFWPKPGSVMEWGYDEWVVVDVDRTRVKVRLEKRGPAPPTETPPVCAKWCGDEVAPMRDAATIYLRNGRLYCSGPCRDANRCLHPAPRTKEGT